MPVLLHPHHISVLITNIITEKQWSLHRKLHATLNHLSNEEPCIEIRIFIYLFCCICILEAT